MYIVCKRTIIMIIMPSSNSSLEFPGIPGIPAGIDEYLSQTADNHCPLKEKSCRMFLSGTPAVKLN